MQDNTELKDFCQVFFLALNSLQKANELPSYMSSKAREINATNIHKFLEEKTKDGLALMQLMHAALRTKINSGEDAKTKESFLKFIEENKPLVDRLKDPNYKLVLDRFIAAHELAKTVSQLIDEILENEKMKEKNVVSP